MENNQPLTPAFSSIVSEAKTYINNLWENPKPLVCIVCGSGWGEVVHEFTHSQSVAFLDVPGLSDTTISGHAGRLHLCTLRGEHILIFQGRRHYYEGEGWQPVVLPILLAKELGVETILLTNAAGGIKSNFQAGDLMAITDHLNFMPGNPLIGPLLHSDCPRFPDQTEVYDSRLRELLVDAGRENGVSIHQGVYLGLSGPAFETPAEISTFGKLGADAVGMSTVPEAMVGNALGIKIAGLSCISNLAAGINPDPLSHKDVENISSLALPKMKATILGFLNALI